MLDLSKAFDLVPHKRLVHKIKGYGVTNELAEWFEDFLRNREQRVVLGNIGSNWAKVLSGVPQGSVLGPLLFVIYINDLPDLATNTMKLYADDSKLLSIVNDLSDASRLQGDLDSVSDWTSEWRMKLNNSKSKVMHYGKQNLNFEYLVKEDDGSIGFLERSNKERDLGVIFSSNLDWEEQYLSSCKKANMTLGMLKRTFVGRDIGLWKQLYVSMVRPHLEYAFQVWSPFRVGDISRLEKVQKRATKIPNILKNIDYLDRLEALHLTTLEKRRTRGDLIYMFKIVKGIDHIDLRRSLDFNDSKTRGHEYRFSREKFSAKRANDYSRFVTIRHNFFLNRIASLWNSLPSQVVSAQSLNSFKARIDKFLK